MGNWGWGIGHGERDKGDKEEGIDKEETGSVIPPHLPCPLVPSSPLSPYPLLMTSHSPFKSFPKPKDI